MLDSFLDWIKIKFKIHSKISRPTFNEREVWWCHLGKNVGDEENGKNESFNRPVLILKKFNNHLALIAPTSRQLKDNPFYIEITYKNQKYSVLTSHIHTIDVKRLQNKISKLDKTDFENVKSQIISYLK